MIPVAEKERRPWRKIAVDLTGPSHALNGNILLTIIDLYSRYPEVYVVKDGSSGEVIDKLKDVFCRWGVPEYLLSDNGRTFVSAEFENFLERCNVVHLKSSVYFPQSNGGIERFHSTLKSRLKRLRSEHPRVHLQQLIWKVLLDVRSSPNEVTGETPFFRMTGRNMVIPLQAVKTIVEPPHVKEVRRDITKSYAQRNSSRLRN